MLAFLPYILHYYTYRTDKPISIRKIPLNGAILLCEFDSVTVWHCDTHICGLFLFLYIHFFFFVRKIAPYVLKCLFTCHLSHTNRFSYACVRCLRRYVVGASLTFAINSIFADKRRTKKKLHTIKWHRTSIQSFVCMQTTSNREKRGEQKKTRKSFLPA